MYSSDTQKRQADYLVMLVWHTIFFAMFAAVTFFLEWDKNVLVFLGAMIALCWVLHFASGVADSYKEWTYFFTGQALLFFYGNHETSLWDLAIVHIFCQILYYRSKSKRMINISMIVCLFTIFFNLIFVTGPAFELSSLNISKLVLHCLVVFAAARIICGLISRDLHSDAALKREIYALEEQNNRTIDFLANVSHELRTPINVITGTSTLAFKSETDPTKKLNILFMQEAGYKLFSIVDEILDYAETSSGRVALFEEDYVFLSLANDIVSEARGLPFATDVEVIFDVDTGIPSILSGDEKKIKKVTRLLLDNAAKFTKEGAVYVRMLARPKSYGVNLCIEVRDTGKGIEEESIDKIADGFYQGNSGRNRSAGGLGLGLPIAYGLVSSMGGFIQVESELGAGTTFTVSIPQRVVDGAPFVADEDRSSIVAGIFIRTDKYALPEVKFFYNETIIHMVRGLGIPVHRVFDLDELKKLEAGYQLTHLFLAREEYDEDSAYFESLAKRMTVTVVADVGYPLPSESRAKMIYKPLWVLPVLNVFDIATMTNIVTDAKFRMICPGVKILVVDDEPMNLMITEGLLKDYQMNVTLAQSGQEALGICEVEPFDIIFLDHMMPEMDGIETMRRLKMLAARTGATMRVVAFTANVISSAREAFIKEGFSEFLSKPVEIAELERVIKRILPDTMVSYVPVDESATADVALLAGAHGGASSVANDAPATPDKEEAPDNAQEGGLKAIAAAGIDIEVGLGYCRGDEAFYEELLRKFAADAPEKQKKIEDYYEARDYGNYRILVHALKSTAKMIGAPGLSDSARRLEDASKNEDGNYIEENHAAAMRQYADVAQAITAALGGDEQAESVESGDDDAAGGGAEISKDDLLSALGEIKQCLETFEADKALSIIDGMAGMRCGDKPARELLKGVRDDIDNFDFAAAQEKVESLAGGLRA